MEASGKKVRLYIGGMTCVNCQNKIEKGLYRTDGIISADVSYNRGTADIVYDESKISLKEIIAVIERLDYKVLSQKESRKTDVVKSICMLTIIIALYGMLQSMGILNLLVPGQLADTKMGYGMLFVIGLITSVHCVAMCGGINISQCIPQTAQSGAENGKLSAFRPAFLYNLGRVCSYTAIGFVLGLVGFLIGGGTEIGLSAFFQGILKIIAGLFMVIMGVNMLGLFPWLRKFTICMPKFLARRIGQEKMRSSQPFIVGILNGFMPCGPLQSMWIVALAAANPFAGALSMFLFSLGTVPLMMGLGSIVSALGKRFTDAVMNVGAVLVVVLGLAMLSQGGALSGLLPAIQNDAVSDDTGAEVVDGVQVVNSTLTAGRYPNITVQAGVPVRWVIDAPPGSINGCNYKMIIRDYGIEYTFQEGENVLTFTPEKTGTVRYSCWMGMIRGSIFVTDGTEGAAAAGGEVSVPTPAGYAIPTDRIAVAEKKADQKGNIVQEVSISLTEEGFSPAVIVVQRDLTVIWNIDVSGKDMENGADLLAPYYATVLPLGGGRNQLSLYPTESFDISTGDNRFYCYVKVVDDLGTVDEEAVRAEAAAYQPLIYPEEIFESPGMSCCGG